MKRFISAVAIVIGGLGVATAHAATTYPGTECVSNSPASLNYVRGRVGNVGGAAVGLECPAVSFNPNGGVALGSKVFVIDQNFNSDVSCNLRLQASTSAGPSGSVSTRHSSGTNATPQMLQFAALAPLANSTILVTCNLPGQYLGYASQVVGYQIN